MKQRMGYLLPTAEMRLSRVEGTGPIVSLDLEIDGQSLKIDEVCLASGFSGGNFFAPVGVCFHPPRRPASAVGFRRCRMKCSIPSCP
jgi:hypothetical protein